jgi:hypothetical protein
VLGFREKRGVPNAFNVLAVEEEIFFRGVESRLLEY